MIRMEPGEQVRAEVLWRMAEAMTHRGPDDSGCWVSDDGRIGLSHRRLSIVDLSEAGRQPMANSDGSVQVVFNGEIYNHRRLRSWLEGRGYRFQSQCDTEALIYLYQELGDEMVERLDGDFAFAIWDDRRRRLLLARDRVGVKPVYYASIGGLFVFASEIKALLVSRHVPREIDRESLYHYLTYAVVPAPRTLFQDVFKLPAAGMLRLDLTQPSAGVKLSRYWEPLPGKMDVNHRDLDGQLKDLFKKSVEKRLMSDVPVGVLFSGGVDSTLNATFFKQLVEPNQVRTYTVGGAGAQSPEEDERESARRRAIDLGTEHHEIQIGEKDLLDAIFAISHFQDEPLADPVCVPLYFVTKLARETGTVVLQAGEGADEIFCGYDNYLRFLRIHQRLWRLVDLLPALFCKAGFHLLRRSRRPMFGKIADVLRRLERGQELFMSLSVAYYEDEKSSVLNPDFRTDFAALDSFDLVAPLYRRINESFPEASFLQKMTYLELQLRLPELLLMRVDKMAMANSVEVRVPFLDRDLVDFALSVPDSFKLRDGVCKEPLKRLATQFIGRNGAYQTKRGFSAPIQNWFRSGLGERMREMLREDRAELGTYFDVDQLTSQLDAGPRTFNQAFQLWVIFNFMVWRRCFFCGDS